jgi:hypothetical protein
MQTRQNCDYYLGGTTKGNVKIAISNQRKITDNSQKIKRVFEEVIPEDQMVLNLNRIPQNT